MTFLEGHLLAQQYWRQQARRDRPMALIAQILLNVHRAEHASPLSLEEVMQGLGYPEEAPPPPTIEQLHGQLELLGEVFKQNGNSLEPGPM